MPPSATTVRDAASVARRSVCLEILLQRLGLELDSDDPVPERESVRGMWMQRLGDLGVEASLLTEERALLERPVGTLTEDELDDLHGRASGALVLLWALGRLEPRPALSEVDTMAERLAESGVLGDGSISGARAAMAEARLRPVDELRAALAAYERTRGKAREPSEPERLFALVAAHHVAWVLDETVVFS
jgi:hypothetical protein